jgi:hypothetical protein
MAAMDTRCTVGRPRLGLDRRITLVWIDSREAVLVRWRSSSAEIERIESEVPPHHRETGHIRHDPLCRHGGGGPSQSAGEPHRLEHLERFLDQVEQQLTDDEEIVVIGPGTVREHLCRRLLKAAEGRGSPQQVTSEASPRMTAPQLVARLRRLRGENPRRRTVGAWRWTDPGQRGASGRQLNGPRRVVNKPRRQNWEA